MRNILTCTCIIIGTIIGAGFASGQEIISFFNRFGTNGIYGIIIACVLFGIISIVTTMLIYKRNINNYESLVNGNKIIVIVMEVFAFVCFCIMVSGITSFIQELTGISYWFCATISGMICFIMLLFKFNGMEKVNMVLVPLIIFGIILLGLQEHDIVKFENYIANSNNIATIENSVEFTDSWFVASVLYASYNTLILLPVLTNFGVYQLKKSQIYMIGMFSSVFLCIMALIIYNTCNVFYPGIMNVQIPILTIAMLQGNGVKFFYCTIIIAAILTTAFSTGYTVLCMRDKKKYSVNAFIICAMAVLFSKLGFANMINTFFPLFRVFRNIVNNFYYY